MNETYRVTVQEDAEGDAFIEFPPEVLTKLGWNEGDDLVWDAFLEPTTATGEFKGAVIYKKT